MFPQPGNVQKIIIGAGPGDRLQPGAYQRASLFSDPAIGAGYVLTTDGAGGVDWQFNSPVAGVFAYTADYSLYGSQNAAEAAGVDYAIQIGANAYTDSDYAIAIGVGANVSASANGIAIGYNADIDNSNHTVCIGYNASGSYSEYSIIIGSGASANLGRDTVVVIGYNAFANSDDVVAIGVNASATVYRSIAIGKDSRTYGYGTEAIAIGYGAKSKYGGVAIGNGVVNTNSTKSFKMGVSATAFIDWDDFTPAAATPTATHYIIANISGTDYRVLLATMP